MHVLYIETFYGGSHKNFADQWIFHSAHAFVLKTLPARFWKWRQAGSALYLSEKIPDGRGFDAMVVSGMTDLGHLKALRPDLPPAMLYVHENQFDYPLSPGERRDYRYGITDLANVSCAEAVVFNSRYNRDSFLEGCSGLLDRLPDALPRSLVGKAREKSRIVHPGIDTSAIDAAGESGAAPAAISDRNRVVKGADGAPLVIWNHRHEHDKDPDTTFRVLGRLAARGVGFSLAILGQRFPEEPHAFRRAREELSDRIVFDGYPPRGEYLKWLKRGDVVVSSALQENFGISVAEAVRAGCHPILPNRLAYPEIIPESFHDDCLWTNEPEYEELLEKRLLRKQADASPGAGALAEHFGRFGWNRIAAELDGILESASRRNRGGDPPNPATEASSP